MKAGIIGYGKMGKDIFQQFSDKLKEAEITVVVRRGAEEHSAQYVKALGKSLRRGRITEEEYAYRTEHTHFTEDMAALSGSDAVIEAIAEDMEAKRGVFRSISGTVPEDCLLLTNTSSLDISSVFEGIPHRERCMGMHFFYPVKLSGYTELNVIPETSREAVEKAGSIVKAVGKTPLVFRGEEHMYLNQVLACAVSHGIYLCEYLELSPSELEESLVDIFPTAGVFGIIDSVGLGLMAESSDRLSRPRTKELLRYGKGKMESWLSSGCPAETGCFMEYISSHTSPTGHDSSKAGLYMTALIHNELSAALAEYTGDKEQLKNAVKDTLGLAEAPGYYHDLYGTEAINSALDELYRATGSLAYKANKEV